MKIKLIIVLFCALLMPKRAFAGIDPEAYYTDANGTEVNTWQPFEAEAPLHVRFVANASDLDADASLEWNFKHTGADGTTSITRYGDQTEYDFVESGLTVVTLSVVVGTEVIESTSLNITISSSHLEIPNAFSPNGDGVNDYFQAKDNHKSIVDFHAYIFNRWGQKLYEWTDFSDEKKGWDGTYNGSPVKDGVYYVLVKARGADGKVYDIRRDVNLIRKFNTTTNGSTTP